MVTTAATLWAVNGTVSKVILTTGLSSMRLAEVRSTGAFVLLALALAAAKPDGLRLRARELPYFILFGTGGLALVQWFYFLAIHRLQVGIARSGADSASAPPASPRRSVLPAPTPSTS
jgi:drug/metabolite transporter (DMT)-like permease